MTIPYPRSGAFTYDVALSFAGEQRRYVEKVAAALRRRGRTGTSVSRTAGAS